jgi:hypothetical protein
MERIEQSPGKTFRLSRAKTLQPGHLSQRAQRLFNAPQAFGAFNNSGENSPSSPYCHIEPKFAHLTHVPLEEIASAKFTEEIRPVLTAFPDT